MVTPLVTLLSVIPSFLILLDGTSAHPLIWNAPAPPPDEGPPLSASAVRDPSLLWREVAGIIGAYVGSVCILLGCLLTIGRRLRHGVQQTNRTLDIEMHKPAVQKPDESRGQSLDTQSNRKSRQRRHHSFSMPWSNSGSRGPESPSSRNGSVSTVDESVVQADRQKAQEEMERLYAAVMEHDANRSSKTYSGRDGASASNRPPMSAPVEGFPEFQHLRQRQQPISPISPKSAKSPGSPLSPRMIPEEQFPPPASQLQSQQSPHHHPHGSSRTEPTSPAQTPKSPLSDRLSKISGLSFLSSNKSRDSVSSPKKLHRPSLRRLPISPPIHSPQAEIQPTYADNQPLSPRIYHPGPPPPNPHQRQVGVSPTQTQSPIDSLHQSTVSPVSVERRTPGRDGREREGEGAGSVAETSSSSLPFRAAFSPAQSPTTKTTVVEWRQSQLGRGAPRTGIPRTPYSPYMPFTPVTPITPSRVVTREQRKRKEKENGLRVMTEEDMVMSDEDMWGS